MSGPYVGLTGNLERDPATGALLVSAGSGSDVDGAWELVFDGGTTDPTSGGALLGVRKGDLWLFGSASEQPGLLTGAWRFEGSSFVRHSTLQTEVSPVPDFNRRVVWGAREYKDDLYIGDRREGRFYKATFNNSNGSLASFSQAAQINSPNGGEDVFPGPVLWGKLYIGTFGRTPAPALNPGIYTWDGTTLTQVLQTGIPPGGVVMSMCPYNGELWISAVNSTFTLCEIWAITSSGATRRVYTGTTCYSLANYYGDLVGATVGVDAKQFVVWTGSGFTAATATFSTGGFDLDEDVLVVGDEIWLNAYYKGIFAYDFATVRNIGLGATVAESPRQSTTSLNYGGPVSITVYNGYVWAVTNQPPKVWRKKLGTNRITRALGRPQKSYAAAPGGDLRVGLGRRKTGRYYAPEPFASTTMTPTNNTLYVAPILMARDTPIDQFAISPLGSGQAGSLFTLCAFNDDGFGYPGTLAFQTAAKDATVAGAQTHAVAGTLLQGVAWVGVLFTAAPTTRPPQRASNAAVIPHIGFVSSSDSALLTPVAGLAATGLTSVPTTFPAALDGVDTMPRVGVRAA